MNAQLSDSFTQSEFERTDVLINFPHLDNSMSAAQVNRARKFCRKVLQKGRDHTGVPWWVSSGYRSPAVNAKVGGAGKSQHLFNGPDAAADIVPIGAPAADAFAWLAFESGITCHQLIYYDLGDRAFFHVGWRDDGKNRGETMICTIQNGRRTYRRITEAEFRDRFFAAPVEAA